METKYADLISQMERMTEAYEAALAAVKAMEATTGELPAVLGVSGSIVYLGDEFEQCRAIYLDEERFAEAALDCGSDFSHEYKDEYTRVEYTMFGFRVFTLARKMTAKERFLLHLTVAEGESNQTP